MYRRKENRNNDEWECYPKGRRTECHRRARIDYNRSPSLSVFRTQSQRNPINPFTILKPFDNNNGFLISLGESLYNESLASRNVNSVLVLSSKVEKEKKINDYITLKLEEGETLIYVNGKVFRQCKYLLLQLDKSNIKTYDKIESIDHAAALLDHELHGMERNDQLPFTPEEEFWAHCSNLQVWAEHDYDTRLIHSNLAWPLLRKLWEAGDPKARKVYKEELIYRLNSGYLPSIVHILDGDYLSVLSDKEIKNIWPQNNYVVLLEDAIEDERVSLGVLEDYLKVFTFNYLDQLRDDEPVVDLIIFLMKRIINSKNKKARNTLVVILVHDRDIIPKLPTDQIRGLFDNKEQMIETFYYLLDLKFSGQLIILLFKPFISYMFGNFLSAYYTLLQNKRLEADSIYQASLGFLEFFNLRPKQYRDIFIRILTDIKTKNNPRLFKALKAFVENNVYRQIPKENLISLMNGIDLADLFISISDFSNPNPSLVAFYRYLLFDNPNISKSDVVDTMEKLVLKLVNLKDVEQMLVPISIKGIMFQFFQPMNPERSDFQKESYAELFVKLLENTLTSQDKILFRTIVEIIQHNPLGHYTPEKLNALFTISDLRQIYHKLFKKYDDSLMGTMSALQERYFLSYFPHIFNEN